MSESQPAAVANEAASRGVYAAAFAYLVWGLFPLYIKLPAVPLALFAYGARPQGRCARAR